MVDIDHLSDDELRERLKYFGISSPVTASTRGVLLGKLSRALETKKNEAVPVDLNSNLKNGVSSSGRKTNRRKSNLALSNFSSDEDDDSEFSGPKTRLRSFRNGNDSSLLEYNRLQHKRRGRESLGKSNDSLTEVASSSILSGLVSPASINDTSSPNVSPLSRGRLLRRRRSEVDRSIFSNQCGSFSDSDADEPVPKYGDKTNRDEPDNPCTYYKNFKLYDNNEDKRNLPVVSKIPRGSQRGTEIRIIHNKNSLSSKILSPDEIVSHGTPTYQSVLPNGMNTSDSNKGGSFEENTWSQSVSIALLILCVCFFLIVGLCYINIQTSLISPLSFITSIIQVFSQGDKLDGTKQIETSRKSLRIYNRDAVPICSDSKTRYCLSNNEYEAVPKLLQVLEELIVPELANHASRYQCGHETQHYMKIDDIIMLCKTHLPLVTADSVKEGLNGFAKLVSLNSEFGIEAIWNNHTAEAVGMAVFPLPKEYLCHILYGLYYILYSLSAGFIAIAAAWMVHQMIRYKKRCSAELEQKSFEMVEQILEMLENACVNESKNFIAVNHIRDCLIPPRDRKAKNDLWNRAVKFIDDHDSRVYREIRLVGGDECQVWRWVAGAPKSPTTQTPKGTPVSLERSWQGKAFVSTETPPNFPSVSPTACLKVRKMFDAELVFGKDWPQRVQDNLLQKCDPAKILHVAVDRESKEGCVYVKCASPHDAGVAFRALHGTWYDGNLVTVKYLRDEKYHERFPASRTVDTPLRNGSGSVRMQRR